MRQFCWLSICWLIFAGLSAAPASGQPRDEQFKEQTATSHADKILLQWKFHKGDAVRVQLQILEWYTSKTEKLTNERNIQFLWKVEDVRPDGTAKLVVRVERVQLRIQDPALTFDSDKDDVRSESFPAESGSKLRRMLFDARSLAEVEFTCDVTPQGAVTGIRGAIPDAMMIGPTVFTPGDFSALPQHPVSIGEDWKVEVGGQSDGLSMRGTATSRLVESVVVDSRPAFRLVTTVKWSDMRVPAGSGVSQQRSESVSNFDQESGRFMDEKLTQQFRLRLPSGDDFDVRSQLMRTLSLVDASETKTADIEGSGRYMFAFKDKEVIPLRLAGVPVRDSSDQRLEVSQFMLLELYHIWNDTTGDGQRESDELVGVNPRFVEGESVNWLMQTVGMEGSDVRMVVLDSHGEQITTSPVRIVAGPSAFATRTLNNLDPGVYFFEWYVNDDLLVRAPIQVFSLNASNGAADDLKKDNASSAKQDAEGREEEPEADSRLFVVKVSEAKVMDSSKVVAAKQIGDVFRAAEVRSPWLLVREPSFTGWVAEKDVVPLAEAVEYFDDLVKKSPKDHSVILGRARLQAWIGEASLRKGILHAERAGAILDLAIADFDRAIDLYPPNPEAVLGRGLARELRSKFSLAIADFGTVLELDPKNIRASFHRAFARYKTDDFPGALQDCNEALTLDLSSAEAFSLRGAVLASMGQLDQAIADEDKAIQLNPKLAMAYTRRGTVWAAKDDDDRALADYSEAIRLGDDTARAMRSRIFHERGQWKETIADLDVLIGLSPDDSDLHFKRATVWFSASEYDKAIADFDRAIELNPSAAEFRTNRGAAFAEKGMIDKARDDFSEAIRLNPDQPAAWLNRSRLYSQSGEHDKAAADLNEVLRLDPDNIDAYVNRGLARYFAHHGEEAIADFSEAINRLQTVPDFYVFRGSAENLTGKYNEAAEDFTRALELAPERADAMAYRGVSWIKLEQSEKALADFNAAIMLNPKLVMAYVNRSGYWLAEGDYARAIADAAKAVELNPEKAAGYNLLAWIQATCPDEAYRNKSDALKNARRANELSEWRNPECLDTLAAASAESGDFEAAVKWASKSLEISPPEPQDERNSRLELYQKGQPYRSTAKQRSTAIPEPAP